MYYFDEKPRSVHEALDRIVKVLKTYFNYLSDEIALNVVGDSITGYIVSSKFHDLPEQQKFILFNNILNNYSEEKKFLGAIMLLSVAEKEYAGEL